MANIQKIKSCHHLTGFLQNFIANIQKISHYLTGFHLHFLPSLDLFPPTFSSSAIFHVPPQVWRNGGREKALREGISDGEDESAVLV